MGIRFHCPNGHKLNVKEFQAGRRGICPFCGARIQIPMQSTRPSGKGRRGEAVPGNQDSSGGDSQISDSAPDILPGEPPILPGDPPGRTMLGPSTPIAPGTPAQSAVVAPPTGTTGAGKPTVATASAPAPKPATIGPTAKPSAGNANLAIVTTEVVTPSPGPIGAPAAQTSVQPPAAPETPDPIAEAPEMIWYVRPPSGGQFGPAPGELMRTWVAEGRVSADSLVWREGWHDWQEAAAVFPKLRGNQFMDFLDTAPAVSNTPVLNPTPTHVHRPKVHAKVDRTFILLISLSVAAVIMTIALFLIILYYK